MVTANDCKTLNLLYDLCDHFSFAKPNSVTSLVSALYSVNTNMHTATFLHPKIFR